MSLTSEFKKRIEELENAIYQSEFDISKYMLPDKEIIKNIIRSKNPLMSKEDIETMVYGYDYKSAIEVASSLINNNQVIPDEISKAVFKGEYDPYPLPLASQYYKEAQNLKNEVKSAASMVMAHKTEMINDLSSSMTMLTTSIPGIAMMVSAPPWNVPGALSLASLVLDSMNDLTSKSIKIINHLQPLKKLDLVLSEKFLQIVIKLLNPVIMVLLAILKPIETIKKFINKLIEKIKSLLNTTNCRKRIRRIKRQLRRKNVELAAKKAAQIAARFPKLNSSLVSSLQEDIDDLQDEIEDLKQQLADVSANCGKKIQLEQDIENLNQLVQDINAQSEVWIETLQYETVYDVQLPDGTLLSGLSEDELELLKKEYTIILNS